MNERFDAIDAMLLRVDTKLDGLSGLVRTGYPDDTRKRFADTERRMMELAAAIRQVTGHDKPQDEYDTTDAATLLKLSVWEICRKCRDGEIRAKKIRGAGVKGMWKISQVEIDRYKREGPLNPPEPPAKD